jgi:hypothetical protein
MKRLSRLLTIYAVAACLLVSRAGAQPAAPGSINAALRYWMAFALMKDPPDGRSGVTAAYLDRVAAGEAAWDNVQLGPILDDNREALEIMRRATQLTSCDWGLEYDLGPSTPIAHLAKARVLGRLNAVSGAEFAARGDWSTAVDVWLAGVRFSQHVASGGTLISLLSARLSLSPSLKSLVRAASQTAVDAARRQQIAAVVGAIPEAGFDFADAMRREADALAVAKRLHPNLNAPMPSQAAVDRVANELRAERRAVLDAVAK